MERVDAAIHVAYRHAAAVNWDAARGRAPGIGRADLGGGGIERREHPERRTIELHALDSADERGPCDCPRRRFRQQIAAKTPRRAIRLAVDVHAGTLDRGDVSVARRLRKAHRHAGAILRLEQVAAAWLVRDAWPAFEGHNQAERNLVAVR